MTLLPGQRLQRTMPVVLCIQLLLIMGRLEHHHRSGSMNIGRIVIRYPRTYFGERFRQDLQCLESRRNTVAYMNYPPIGHHLHGMVNDPVDKTDVVYQTPSPRFHLWLRFL